MVARLSRLIAGVALAAPSLLAAIARPVPAAAQARDAGDPVSGRQVLTAAALRRAGIVRTGDLLLLAKRWDVVTIDGITWQASAHGLAPLADGRWTVLVDGQPLDLGLFGTLDLNRSAVPLGTIDSVEVIDAPTLRVGQVAGGGVLHIHTARPRRGLSAGGWMTTGSEIGEPGPFAFTPEASANVDRSGHEYAVRAAYGAERWWVEASLNATEYPPTDPALLGRYGAAAVGLVRVNGTAPALRGGVRLLGGEHQVTYRYSRLSDFFSLVPLPGPLAATEQFAHLGVDGAIPVGNAGRLRYFAVRSVNRSDGARREPATFAWRAVTWTAGLEAARGSQGTLGPQDVLDSQEALGIRFRRTEAADAYGEASVYGRLRPRLSDGFRPTLVASLGLADEHVGVAAAVTERWAVTSRSDLRASVSYFRRTPADDGGIWAWTERGFSYLGDAGIDAAADGSIGVRDETAAELAAAALVGSGVRLHAAAQWRLVDGLALARQELHYLPSTESFAGPARLAVGRSGQVAGLEAGLSFGARGKLQGEASYRFRRPVAGDGEFREAWAAIARHAARATAAYLPVPGFELQLAVSYRSATRWADYHAVEIESAGRYRAVVPASLVFDVTAQKWLWDGRLRALVGLGNVTGAPQRYHPAGATWSPALVLQAEATVP